MKRIFGAVALAMALAPLGALAQQPARPPDLCLRACSVEYDNAVAKCGNDQACAQAADGAYKTCVAVCPANK